MLQPLDVAYFRPLKVYYKNEKSEYERVVKRNMKKYELPKVLEIIFKKYCFGLAMKNGFRKCGIFPFDPCNVDYTKCVKKSRSGPDVENPEQRNAPNSETILQYIESKLDENVLNEFRCTKGNWTGNAKFEELFNLWKSLLADDKSYFFMCPTDGIQMGNIPAMSTPKKNVGFLLSFYLIGYYV